MDRARVCDFDLHAILDGEAPPERLAEILPGLLLEDPDSAERLADLEEQRQALLALGRALDEGVPPRPPSEAEIAIGHLIQRDRQIRRALAALGAMALLLSLGLDQDRVLH
jgi:anti-sigma factor RsiW